jgi:hypothetical protein
MAITESTRVRAPRGTKTLTQAFFAALDEIPEPRRAAVAKAAQLAIREELRGREYKEKTGRATRGPRAGSGAARAAATRRAAPKRRGRPRRVAED